MIATPEHAIVLLILLSASARGQVTVGPDAPAAGGHLILAPTPPSEAVEQSLLYYRGYEELQSYPGRIFTGDRGCSPSALLSFLTFQKQVVPVEEVSHYAVRLLQSPSTDSNAVPDNVLWLDFQTGVLVTGIPKLNWTQQTTVFNYTLLTPGLADHVKYRSALGSLAQLVSGLAAGSSSPSTRYRCASRSEELQPLADYLADIQADIANASAIDGGLKRGIEYRVPAGCIVELDAAYAGTAIGSIITPSSGASVQPTENDCCRACRMQQGCNVFVFCPSFEGCRVGDAPFPAFGCQLKTLANLSESPEAFPAALQRGPPSPFKSGTCWGDLLPSKYTAGHENMLQQADLDDEELLRRQLLSLCEVAY